MTIIIIIVVIIIIANVCFINKALIGIIHRPDSRQSDSALIFSTTIEGDRSCYKIILIIRYV